MDRTQNELDSLKEQIEHIKKVQKQDTKLFDSIFVSMQNSQKAFKLFSNASNDFSQRLNNDFKTLKSNIEAFKESIDLKIKVKVQGSLIRLLNNRWTCLMALMIVMGFLTGLFTYMNNQSVSGLRSEMATSVEGVRSEISSVRTDIRELRAYLQDKKREVKKVSIQPHKVVEM